jgi:hypothetical protein
MKAHSREAGISLIEMMIVCAIVTIVVGLSLASVARRDEGSRIVEDVAARIRARRAAALRLNALTQPTLLENYVQPPISIDFSNASTTATLVTDGTTHTVFNAPSAAGGTGSWTYVYQGSALSLPSGWRVATSATNLAPIPTIVLGTPATAFAFAGDGRLDSSSLPGAPQNTNPNQESPFPAIYLTDGRTARAVAVHPSGLTEIWRYDEAAGLWRGFGSRQAIGP